MGPKPGLLFRILGIGIVLVAVGSWKGAASLEQRCPAVVSQTLPGVSQDAAANVPASGLRMDRLRCRLSANRPAWMWATAGAALFGATVQPAFGVSFGFFGLGAYIALMRPPFSPVDELQHVSYAHHLAHHGQPPSAKVMQPADFPDAVIEAMGAREVEKISGQMILYQGFQPPGGYAVGALVLRILEATSVDLATSFLLLRLCGVASLSLGLFLFVRAQGRLSAQCDWLDPVGAAVCTAALVSSHQFVDIMAVITNDQSCTLAIALVATAAVALLERPQSAAAWRTLGLAGGFAWLCKMTWLCVPMAVVGAARLARPRRLAEVLRPMAAMVVPWYLHNLYTYHALTGTRAHLRNVIPYINPTGGRYPWNVLAYDGMMHYFFAWFSAAPAFPWQVMVQFNLGLALVGSCAFGWQRGAMLAWRWRQHGPEGLHPSHAQDFVVWLLAASLTFPFALTLTTTAITGGWYILGRYSFAFAGGAAPLLVMSLRAAGLSRAAVRVMAMCLFYFLASSGLAYTEGMPYLRDPSTQHLRHP